MEEIKEKDEYNFSALQCLVLDPLGNILLFSFYLENHLGKQVAHCLHKEAPQLYYKSPTVPNQCHKQEENHKSTKSMSQQICENEKGTDIKLNHSTFAES